MASRNTDNLVALLMLRCGDCQPRAPGSPGEGEGRRAEGAKSALLPRAGSVHKLPKPRFFMTTPSSERSFWACFLLDMKNRERGSFLILLPIGNI